MLNPLSHRPIGAVRLLLLSADCLHQTRKSHFVNFYIAITFSCPRPLLRRIQGFNGHQKHIIVGSHVGSMLELFHDEIKCTAVGDGAAGSTTSRCISCSTTCELKTNTHARAVVIIANDEILLFFVDDCHYNAVVDGRTRAQKPSSFGLMLKIVCEILVASHANANRIHTRPNPDRHFHSP